MQFSPVGVSLIPGVYDIDPDIPKDVKDLGCDVVKLVADVLSVKSVAHASRESLRNLGSVAQDSVLAVFGTCSTAIAVANSMTSGLFSPDALSAVANSLNVMALADRAVQAGAGIGIGAGNYQAVTGNLVTTATLVSRAYQGDVPGAILSGGKLLTSIACTGGSLAQILVAADMLYVSSGWLPIGR
ncbi:hypothetical protein [Bordetella muralis]|jgi:hypothetical protein|uniref:hypothetical protein n=1 Tax=Bordetella muralis TaxID=1649130 RepID=UPI0039EF60AE